MSFAPVIQLSALDGVNGFRLDGACTGDRVGVSVSSAGDVNGDGYDDVIVGAYQADPNGNGSGATYVVFGGSGGFPPVRSLSALSGSDGFRIDGIAADDCSGYSVSSAGDVNGDGLDDLIIGAFAADRNGGRSGESYVVFGSSGGFPAVLQLLALDGNDGFRLQGVSAYDTSGVRVSSAGDVNGDGLDDVIVGAMGVDANGQNSGAAYVVFGRSDGFPADLQLSDLAGGSGFRIKGAGAFDYAGYSVSAAGDVNGDGLDDVIIGARAAIVDADRPGAAYVVFGRSDGFPAEVELSDLSGSNGFRLAGVSAQDRAGTSVSAAGDVNGDGYDDIIVGAGMADWNGNGSGSSYVVFGRSGGFPASLDLSALSGSDGFRLDGGAADDWSGRSVAGAGDVNGDGYDDIIISALRADPNGTHSGASYVVFGRSGGFPAVVQLSALGGGGFRLDGAAANDRSGSSVSSAGDFNGDGLADLIVGAIFAHGNEMYSGAAYVVFGSPPAPPSPPAGPGNSPPDASDDRYSVIWNHRLSIPMPGVLGNDTDADGDRLSVLGVASPPGHGALVWSPDGGFVYTPNAAFVGSDAFVYRVTDGRGGEDTATVRISVLPDPTEAPRLPVSGGFGNDRIWGTHLVDTIHGGGGDDTIWGGGGRDLLNGEMGDDRVYGEGDEDVAWGGQGNDLVDGGPGNDWVLGDRGDDTVQGGPGNDHGWGGRGDDLVLGGAGEDVLHGGFGADTLDGGTGRDLLTGSADADVFLFGEGCGLDRVLDFQPSGGDRIVIDTGGDGVLNGIAFAGFADILARLVEGPDGVFLWLGEGPQPLHGLTIEGVTLADLTADHFLIL